MIQNLAGQIHYAIHLARNLIVLVGLPVVLLAACNPSDQNAEVSAGQPAIDRGKLMFLQCQACHTLDAGGVHLVGPNLAGFFGQPAGIKKDFRYSEALLESELTWTAETLDPWLERPTEFLPGTTMAFVGIANAEDRASLIKYLLAETEAVPGDQ